MKVAVIILLVVVFIKVILADSINEKRGKINGLQFLIYFIVNITTLVLTLTYIV